MNKIIIVYCALLFCSCASMEYSAYSDYEHSIDLTYIQNGEFYVPAFDVTINNKKYYAVYNTGYKENIISKDILHELEIGEIDSELNVTIPEIVLSDSLVLYNIIFTVIEDASNIFRIKFGLSAFNGYNVLVSYKQNKILLYNTDILPSYLVSWVPVTNVYPDDGLYIHGLVRDSMKIYLFWLNTGTTLYIEGIFNRHYNISLDTSIPLASLFRSSIYIGSKRYRDLYFYSLSDKTKKDINLEGTLTDIILGYDFFNKYDMFIENNNKKVYLEQP